MPELPGGHPLMEHPSPLNRRQWLQAAGLTLAGAVLAPLLGAQPVAAGGGESPEAPPSRPLPARLPRGDRRYIHGFEADLAS